MGVVSLVLNAHQETATICGLQRDDLFRRFSPGTPLLKTIKRCY